uniref:protein-tyrosine-phosphatase n=1 Tax=Ditylenchus dipsaci TaxID=166011 RepID=A0A915DC58_9BILA
MLRMPLKLKWGKKSGRYELSQEIYVLTIFVGDFSLIQCTLATESTARQCVDYLCEKMDLNQAEIFGFRFQMRFNDPDRRLMRWVEMDKPLRKQLEKWACKPRQVQLAILYHTPNVFSLHDQMARSLYFMLLKLDVLNGKYSMDMDKYINLAAYSLQVENSDFDRTLHTMDYLRSVKLLPQHLCRNSQQLDECLVKILTVYERLSGMQPSYAAFLYIVDVQQCEGYGEECFQAKDDESTEVKLGYSLEEIFVKRYNGSTIKYKWPEIKDITSLKRNLTVKCLDGSSAVFALEDCDMSKYVNMVLNWQLRYATTDAIQQKSVPMSINNLQGGIRTFGAQQPMLFRHSNADIHSTRTTNSIDMGMPPILQVMEFNTSSLFNVNSLHNCQSTVHSVQSFSHPPISATLSVNCNRSSTLSQLILPPSVSTPTLTQNALMGSNGIGAVSPVYRPPTASHRQHHVGRPPALSLPQTPPSSAVAGASQVDADWLKLEQREILKQLLAERKSNKSIGSSPEIHMLGTNSSTPPASNSNFNGANSSKNYGGKSHLMRKANHPRMENTPGSNLNQRTANYSDEKTPLHTSSNPDICCSKWCSTPDLLSTHAFNHVDSTSHPYAPTQSSLTRRELVHRESCPNYPAVSSSSIQQQSTPPRPHARSNVQRGPSLPSSAASHLRVNTNESFGQQSEVSPGFNNPPSLTPPNSAVHFSQGHVVSGVSRTGQPITYPIPANQTREQIPSNNNWPAHRSPGRSGRKLPSQTSLLMGSPGVSKENQQISVAGCQFAYPVVGGNEASIVPPYVHQNAAASLPSKGGVLLSSAGASLISSMEEDDLEGEEDGERSSPPSSSCSCSANLATENLSSSYIKLNPRFGRLFLNLVVVGLLFFWAHSATSKMHYTSSERKHPRMPQLHSRLDYGPEKKVETIKWWMQMQESKWSDIAKLALSAFTVPASSSPIERVFSWAGMASNKLRNE